MVSILSRSRKRISPLFLIAVVIPTFGAILYFGIFASNVYVSEAKFVIRSPDKPATSGFGVLLKTAGFSNANDEVYAAQDFLKSRDALRSINERDAFLKAYTLQGISIFDRFNPSGFYGSFEDLYRYFLGKVAVDYDSSTSITTLTVRAYDATAANRFNERLLELAEQMINRLNTRGRNDLVRFAQAEVDDAQRSARSAAGALANYRNRAGVVDPEKQATVQLQMVSKLQDELIASRTQLAEIKRYAPLNPQVDSLQTRIASVSRQIDVELGKVAGGNRSLAKTAERYQQLLLDSQFSDKQLTSALASLEEAKNEARRKQAYVERIVQPNRPDHAIEPRRLRGILVTMVLGLVSWGILSMLLAGVREHQD